MRIEVSGFSSPQLCLDVLRHLFADGLTIKQFSETGEGLVVWIEDPGREISRVLAKIQGLQSPGFIVNIANEGGVNAECRTA